MRRRLASTAATMSLTGVPGARWPSAVQNLEAIRSRSRGWPLIPRPGGCSGPPPGRPGREWPVPGEELGGDREPVPGVPLDPAAEGLLRARPRVVGRGVEVVDPALQGEADGSLAAAAGGAERG